MARRKIAEFESGVAKVIVQRDCEWQEYRARLYVAGVLKADADYHTTDKCDALHTAQTMVHTAATCSTN